MKQQKEPKDKRAAIYVRVSTVYQIDKDSLPMQRQELTAYCELVLGIKDYEIYEDAGYSGKNTDRPAYQKMMQSIRDGVYTHLLVWKIDRISRNLLDFASMYEELKKLSVTFISKNEQFDTSSAMGEAMLKIILVFAELERGMTSERVTAAMINRATNGIWNGGRVPFGYSYDKETQTFSPEPEESKTVLLIYDQYEQTRSVVNVARLLNSRHIVSRNGIDFSPVTVYSILRSPWYTGTYRYNYYKIPGRKAVKDESEWVIVENHHPALVSQERFDNVQSTLDRNARYRNEPGRPRSSQRVNIFSGLLWCGVCGAGFTASPARSHASGYRPSKYACASTRKTLDCGAKSVSDTVLGEFLINYILNILNAQKNFGRIRSPLMLQKFLLSGSTFSSIDSIEQDGLNSLYNILSEYSGTDPVLLSKKRSKAKVDPELTRLKKERQKQERALERLNHIYLYSDNQMTDQEYITRKQEITTELSEVNSQIGMAQQEPWTSTMSDEEFLETASTFILKHELANKQYIYFTKLAETTDPNVLKLFFQSVLDSVILVRGQIRTIVFKNGISNTFLYKKDGAES